MYTKAFVTEISIGGVQDQDSPVEQSLNYYNRTFFRNTKYFCFGKFSDISTYRCIMYSMNCISLYTRLDLSTCVQKLHMTINADMWHWRCNYLVHLHFLTSQKWAIWLSYWKIISCTVDSYILQYTLLLLFVVSIQGNLNAKIHKVTPPDPLKTN